ncbi:MAG: FkbM family methyltransferase [Hyphomicrobiales bacterium]|nr:FkbM family methyltransferase [Hyphomicrobiales bacterium]
MNPLLRLASELGALYARQPISEFAGYLMCLAGAAPGIVRQRTLAPADARMQGTVTMRVNGQDLQIPLGRIAKLLEGHDDTPTFGGLREMYAANVYLRAFKPGFRIGTVVDLGANRGLFSLLAVKAYGARIAVGVEPSVCFSPVADLLRRANDVADHAMPREVAFAGSKGGAGSVSMAELMKSHELGQIDYLKCDIEGGEFDVFLNGPDFLDKVGNIAMELHPHCGPVNEIVDLLQLKGFAVLVTDQFGRAVDGGLPHYLYASRIGDLLQ